MKDIDLNPALKKSFSQWPRQRGRYKASELWAISEGRLTPEEWMTPPEPDTEGMLKMWMGRIMHDHIEKLLPQDCNEIKRVHEFKDIVVVAKADHLPKHVDEVWEFKTAEDEKKAKPWDLYQARSYCSIFERPKAVVFQPVQGEGLFLKNIGEVERDDAWFNLELEKLYQFHLEVERLWEAKDNKS
jgi:hypothetical protein